MFWLFLNAACVLWLAYILTAGVAFIMFGDGPWPLHQYFWTAIPLVIELVFTNVMRMMNHD